MTTVITRYFTSADQAGLVRNELYYQQRFAASIMRLYADADGLVDKLAKQNVEDKTAKAYEKKMAKGGAVLLVRAGYKPLGVAQTTRDVTAAMGAVDMGKVAEEFYVKDPINADLSVLDSHPHILTRRKDPSGPQQYYMADWPIQLISRRKPFNYSVIPRHGRMASWPFPLLSNRKPYTESIVPRHGRMANFPIPLISNRKPYTGSVIEPHARMANFPIALISKRKPFNRSIFPRHQRMANWPFPHLINGKTGTNALMPGAPRMANFPIGLLSNRKPFTGSIVPKHARMANFPIPLISKRQPYTGSAIKPHGRMADFPLPLVVKKFSLSAMFGIPTVLSR